MEDGRMNGWRDGLHVWGAVASIPWQRRHWAELPREGGVCPKAGLRAKTPCPTVPPWGPRQSVVGGLSSAAVASITSALPALPGSGTNFGPCHAQGD